MFSRSYHVIRSVIVIDGSVMNQVDGLTIGDEEFSGSNYDRMSPDFCRYIEKELEESSIISLSEIPLSLKLNFESKEHKK